MQGHDRTSNFNSELWPVIWPRWDIFYLAQREHAVDDFAKDDVLPVEEIARRGRDEELHRSWLRMMERRVGKATLKNAPGNRSCWGPSWPIRSEPTTASE